MTWKGHVGFAICFVVAMGVMVKYGGPIDTRIFEHIPKASVLERYSPPGGDGVRVYRYKPMALPKKKTTYTYVTEIVSFLADIVTVLTPMFVVVTWAYATVKRRKVKS